MTLDCPLNCALGSQQLYLEEATQRYSIAELLELPIGKRVTCPKSL